MSKYRKRVAVVVLAVAFAMWGAVAQAQQKKLYRIGAIHQGGPYQAVVDGLRLGLRELGYEEGKHTVFDVRDTKSDLKAAAEAAKAFELGQLNLIYVVTTSAAAVVKNATSQIPIVFSVGTDPVQSGLVQSFGKPGGRLTGIQYSTTDLTAKRLEILKEILPKLGRVITFYNPGNPSGVAAAALAREAAKQFEVQLVERHVQSVEALRQGLAAIKPKEADAYFYISDAMVNSHARLVIEMTKSKKLPAMFSEQSPVVIGGLASYGQNFRETGRLSAKHVQKLMTGAAPAELRVDTVDRFELIINLKTAKEIGLTIAPEVLARADKVIR
jgi:putative ABC transport system substrate-binding protein